MRTRIIAVMELVLVFPAAFFMAVLVLRNLQPQQNEGARLRRGLENP